MEIHPVEIHEEFSDEIWPQSSEALLARMTEHAHHGVERVVLDMATPGGEVASAMMLLEKLSESPIELVTHAMGEVASMGVVLFLAGDKRLASPEATFLLHPVKLVLPGSSLEVDAKALRRISARLEHSFNPSPARLRELDLTIARVEREDNSVQTILEQRTKLTGSDIKALIQCGEPVDAAYAKAVGIVHEVIPHID
jgi:ATP-dependent protease ClpP protease subunit